MDNMDNVNVWADNAMELIMDFGPKVVSAVLVLLIGLRIIKMITRQTGKLMEKRDVDPTLRPFLSSMVNWGLKALLFISVAGMVGIATTSFVAVLGAASLAVGLAFQGSLANFAGGGFDLGIQTIQGGRPYRGTRPYRNGRRDPDLRHQDRRGSKPRGDIAQWSPF